MFHAINNPHFVQNNTLRYIKYWLISFHIRDFHSPNDLTHFNTRTTITLSGTSYIINKPHSKVWRCFINIVRIFTCLSLTGNVFAYVKTFSDDIALTFSIRWMFYSLWKWWILYYIYKKLKGVVLWLFLWMLSLNQLNFVLRIFIFI